MHDSLSRSAAAGQQGRSPSESLYGFSENYVASPDSVRVKREPPDCAHQSTIGLEVIHGLPLTPSISVHSWQNQPITDTTARYNPAVSAPDYSGLSYFQQEYATPTVVGASSIQYPAFTSTAEAQPIYYTSSYDPSQTSTPDYGQNSPKRWAMTLSPHISSPGKIAHQSDRSLERSSSPRDSESISEYNTAQSRSFHGSVSSGASATAIRASRRNGSTGQAKDGTGSNAELRCQICGKTFTRRSNCREHIKRHNPQNRQVHVCNGCGKTFGRKTDLRRHYSTRIHDGGKKFECERCGKYYSRLDTMHRHQKDGCPARKRKVRMGNLDSPMQLQTPSSALPSDDGHLLYNFLDADAY